MRIQIVEDDRAIADSVALNLKYVGYEYIVFDDSSHNASKGTASGKTLRFMFNRLVDTDNIEYLVLNGEKLTR